MTTIEGGSPASAMVQRIRNLLLRPDETWAVIDAEPATPSGLYKGWVIPLVGLSVVCAAIGQLAFGNQILRPGPITVTLGALLGFAVQLVLVWLVALVIDALAPSFGGQKNRLQALKVTAYGGTAAWLAGVFQIFPPLAFLGLVGLYSLWLYYRGLPRLMKVPDDKALPYTGAVVAIAIVLMLVGGAITGAVMALTAMGPMMGARADNEEIAVPGVGTVDVAQLEEAARKMEAGQDTAAVDPEALKAYLPQEVVGYTRTGLETGRAGAAGLSGSGAEGTYAKGTASLRLSVTDLASAAPLAAMAGALDISTSSEKGGSYEKVGRVDGRMAFEKFDKDAGRGEYSVLIADRFMVAASGEGVAMAELKAAVAAVDPAGLEGLADS